MLINYGPKFKIVEINNVASLRMGHMIDQIPAYVDGDHDAFITATTFGEEKFVENGLIVGLDRSNALANYDASQHSQPCLVYTEELTGINHLELDGFAHRVPGIGKPVYVRALPLSLGDTFTTNNVVEMVEDAAFAKVNAEGKLELETARSADTMFIAKMSDLPAGQKAIEFTYIGLAAKPIVITDLTGTIWKFNDEVTAYTSDINLNFKTNNLEYSSMEMDSTWGNISYDSTQVYIHWGNKWKDDYNGTYSAIEITGGDDVKNSDVIAWLQANAKRINKLPELAELIVDDLTGTTWLMPETFVQGSLAYSYAQNSLDVNFTSNNKNFARFMESMGGDLEYVTPNDEELIYAYSQETGWENEAYRTIEITGGESATDGNLIHWLDEFATLVEE